MTPEEKKRRNRGRRRRTRGLNTYAHAPFDGTIEVYGDGIGTLSWANSTAGRSVVCADGVMRFGESSEATFSGYRRVEAMVEASDDNFDIGTWDLLGGTRNGQEYTPTSFAAIYMNNINNIALGMDIRVTVRYRYISGTDALGIYTWNDGTVADWQGNIPYVDNEWHEYTTLITIADGTPSNYRFGIQNRTTSSGTTIEIDYMMIEDMSGYSNQDPSEVLRSTVDYKVSAAAAVTGVAYRKAKPSCTLTQVGSTNTYEVTNRNPQKTVMNYPEDKLWGIDFQRTTTNKVTTPREWAGTWTDSAVVTTGTTRGIDGRNIGNVLQEDDTTALHYAYEAQTVAATNAAMTVSAYVKRVAGTHNCAIAIADSTFTNVGGAKLNMTTGAASAVTVAGSPTIHWVDVIEYANGWFRLMACVDTNTAGTTANVAVYITDDTETLSYTGDNSSSICFDCVQLEEIPICTSYIEGTRNAHGTLKTGLNTFGPNQSNTLLEECAMRYKITHPHNDAGVGWRIDSYNVSQTPFGWDSNEPLIMSNGGSANLWQIYISGNASALTGNRPTPTQAGGFGQPVELRARLSTREDRKYIGAGGVVYDQNQYDYTNADYPTSTTGKIGFGYGTDLWYCLKDAEFIGNDSKNDEWLVNKDSEDR